MVGRRADCPTCGVSVFLLATIVPSKAKRTNSPKQYWIQNQQGAWGPFEWKTLRDWFASGWLVPETQVHECSSDVWQSAEAVPSFWKLTASLRNKIESFGVPSLMSEKLPVSAAQTARLAFLGWPGNALLLRNYYWANKLRESLEKMLPDGNRPAFDDPAWPWSDGCPAQRERWQCQEDAGPPTDDQQTVLQFFHGPQHRFTMRVEAQREVVKLLANSETSVRWWKYNENIPASDRQVARLKWAARRLGRSLPKPLNKTIAHRLIDDWFGEFPELEDDWLDENERRREAEIDG